MTTIKKSKTTNVEKADLTLVIEGDYKDFQHFYNTNKKTIYENIIDLFSLISTGNKEIGTLVVFYDIDKVTFNTAFNFGKSDKKMLKDVFIPYFSGMEEYETCSKVKTLYDSFTD